MFLKVHGFTDIQVQTRLPVAIKPNGSNNNNALLPDGWKRLDKH